MKRRFFFFVILCFFIFSGQVFPYFVEYKEQYYKLYHIHYEQDPDDIVENIYWLERAINADFCNPLHALGKITTKKEWEKYRYMFMMHLNLKMVEQHLRLGSKYDKQLFLAEKFLNMMRPFTWFIITKFRMHKDFDLILKTIRTSLTEYMDKTKIAEYIALMLMELILSAENMNLRKEALILFPELDDPQEALFDPEIRRRLVAELEKKQELVFVSWKLGSGGVASIGTQGKLQITLYSKNEQSDAVRANLNDLKMADVDKNSLIDFYRALPEGSEDLNLGMYYISYLNDACEKVNVRFESSANRFEDTDLTVMNMSFMF